MHIIWTNHVVVHFSFLRFGFQGERKVSVMDNSAAFTSRSSYFLFCTLEVNVKRCKFTHMEAPDVRMQRNSSLLFLQVLKDAVSSL